ncbi:Bcfmp10 [Apiospora marii]|uniref:Bcfmp10 n=1 Tax=Apiospora marii TaxID=335849 RepID=A0ABR1RE57_9PEZI
MIRPRHPTNLRLCRALVPSHSLLARNATTIAATRCCTQQPQPRLKSQWQQRSFATTPARFEVRNSNEPSKQSPIAAAAEGPQKPVVPDEILQEEEAQQQTPPPRRRRRGLIYAVVFACLGATVGSLFRLSISPPPLPAQGTPEDQYILSGIRERAAKLPLVQRLSADPAWETWEAYDDRGPTNSAKRQGSVTAGSLAGSKGLAYQRVFWHRDTGELVNVVYFGGGTAGWPGVVHGGALATVLDETRTGVTARLELNYKKPTVTNAFYTVRTRPVVEEGDEVAGKDGSRKSDRKLWVHGHVEAENGRVCVEARALFVVPKGINLAPLETRW